MARRFRQSRQVAQSGFYHDADVKNLGDFLSSVVDGIMQ